MNGVTNWGSRFVTVTVLVSDIVTKEVSITLHYITTRLTCSEFPQSEQGHSIQFKKSFVSPSLIEYPLRQCITLTFVNIHHSTPAAHLPQPHRSHLQHPCFHSLAAWPA